MPDVLSPEQRHKNMSNIKSKNTKPEMIVRSLVHRMGYRYRLHNKDLPGKPDLVFSRYKKIIEVYGCYWHMHDCKYGKVTPQTNAEFWKKKRKGNVVRDNRNQYELKKHGWEVLIIWECQTKDIKSLTAIIDSFLKLKIRT